MSLKALLLATAHRVELVKPVVPNRYEEQLEVLQVLRSKGLTYDQCYEFFNDHGLFTDIESQAFYCGMNRALKAQKQKLIVDQTQNRGEGSP